MSAVFTTAATIRDARTDYPRLALLSLGHCTNDLYGNLITALMPYLVIQGKISTTLAGLILLVYLMVSSILQPLFGYFSDASGRRLFVALGPLWLGVAAAILGWAPNAASLLAVAGIGGIGTAAFHPQAASMVSALSENRKAWAMSIFSMGGNIGFSLGPVAAAGLALAGLHWTPAMLVLGMLLTVLLVKYAPRVEGHPASAVKPQFQVLLRGVWRPMSLIVAVIATRSAVQYTLIIFLPLYYHLHGGSAQLGSYYAFILSFFGSLGGLIGGHLADSYGRKPVVVFTLFITAPLLYIALLASGPVVWALIVMSGAMLLASNSVTVVQGQALLPDNTGVASGLTMGFGFGLAGIIAAFLTALSDHIGVRDAILLVPLLAVAAAVFSAYVPDGHPPRTV